jgi:hypothetical protein
MRRRFDWGLLALGLYLLSLVLPCVIGRMLFSGAWETEHGITCLVWGWTTLPWYANPLLLSAALANHWRAHELAGVFAICGLVLALTLFVYDSDELRPHVGYYVWLASMIATAISSFTSKHDLDDREARERELLRLMSEASRGP